MRAARQTWIDFLIKLGGEEIESGKYAEMALFRKSLARFSRILVVSAGNLSVETSHVTIQVFAGWAKNANSSCFCRVLPGGVRMFDVENV